MTVDDDSTYEQEDDVDDRGDSDTNTDDRSNDNVIIIKEETDVSIIISFSTVKK